MSGNSEVVKTFFQMSGGYVTYKYVIPVFVEWIQDFIGLLRPDPTTTTPFTTTSSTTGRCFKLTHVSFTDLRWKNLRIALKVLVDQV